MKQGFTSGAAGFCCVLLRVRTAIAQTSSNPLLLQWLCTVIQKTTNLLEFCFRLSMKISWFFCTLHSSSQESHAQQHKTFGFSSRSFCLFSECILGDAPSS